jgi:hypothetical protein
VIVVSDAMLTGLVGLVGNVFPVVFVLLGFGLVGLRLFNLVDDYRYTRASSKVDMSATALPASSEVVRWSRYIAGDPVNRSEWDGTAWEATRER